MGGHVSFFFFLFFFLLRFNLSLADDAAAMLQLSQCFTTAPPGWVGSDPCKWKGVSCDSSNKVTSINLISKSLSGKLPTDVFNPLSSLRTLSLQQNRITGSLPSLSNLHNLKEVYFDGNQFTSFPTKFVSNLPGLHTLSLTNNPLGPWTLPGDSLSQLTALHVFRASSTNIYGQIPDIFDSMLSLTELRLSYNNLTGPLPTSFAGSAIQNIWVNDQKSGLSGSLDVLGGMQSLAQAWLHHNSFVGMIPDLSKCTQLFDLQLRGNRLTGLVPVVLTHLPKLANISLQNNMLQGQVPVFKKGVEATMLPGNSFCNPKPGSCDPQVMVLLEIAGAVGYPIVLAESWKGNDACDGWAHVTCDSTTKSITDINFAKQGFLGTISPMFGNLTWLTTLELSKNRLYGKIPVTLLSLKRLKRLDVSNNNLTGRVPDFQKTVVTNVNNNPFIGTDVDTTPGVGSSQGPRRSASSKSSSLSPVFIVGIAVLLIAASAFAIYFLLLKKKGFKFPVGRWDGNERQNTPDGKYKSSNGSPAATSSTVVYDGGSFVYSIQVLQQVTNDFSDDNILGKGGFGVVYRGELPDGTQIAVKRMESDSLGTKGLSEFQAEIRVLSKVRHRHLVALLGFCVNANERFIVYECMPKGTLAQNLFRWKELGTSPMTWKQRLVIALDVARGIEYLHSLAQESFIHRDLKPSNILLGSDMRAKVSDFGLVKNAPDGIHSLETRLAGTFGYLAPEYAETGRVTTKVDVYAYGVVLMEIITGRKALDQTLPDEEMQLATWFRRVMIEEDDVRRAIDPSMEVDDSTYESIRIVGELAGHCTTREALQRPDMGHVVSIISPLVNKWRPVECGNGEASDSEITLPQAMRKWQTGETSTMTDCSHSQSMVNSSSPTTPRSANTDDHLDIESQRPVKEERGRDD